MRDIDPSLELHIKELFETERQEANKLYAIKLVETIVFTMVGTILLAVISALIGLIVL